MVASSQMTSVSLRVTTLPSQPLQRSSLITRDPRRLICILPPPLFLKRDRCKGPLKRADSQVKTGSEGPETGLSPQVCRALTSRMARPCILCKQSHVLRDCTLLSASSQAADRAQISVLPGNGRETLATTKRDTQGDLSQPIAFFLSGPQRHVSPTM